MTDNFNDMYTFIKEQKNFIREQEENDKIKEYTTKLFGEAKPNLNEFSGSFSITYEPMILDMENNIFSWKGTLGPNVQWLYSYGQGKTGFHITTEMLVIDEEILEALKKMGAYFDFKFAQILKTYI
jgi:hypothetical protein